MDLEALFNQAKQEEVANATEKSPGYVKWDEDTRFIKFKAGNTYQFRLLYSVDDPTKRNKPFIAKYTHSHWDEDADFDKLKIVTCPTSEYILYNKGFTKCPICKATRKFYKDKENGSESAEELYSQYRRKFHGYAMVYVINDPTNEENNGTIKLIHYGVTIQKWLKLQIFGINEKGELVDDDCIGADAFKLDKGYNLKITVGKKGEYNSYTCEFARKPSKIDITQDDIAQANIDLKFDEEYCTRSTDEELDEFYKKYVLAQDVEKQTGEIDIPLDADEDDIPMGTTTTTTSGPIVEDSDSDDDFNIDDILDKI